MQIRVCESLLAKNLLCKNGFVPTCWFHTNDSLHLCLPPRINKSLTLRIFLCRMFYIYLYSN